MLRAVGGFQGVRGAACERRVVGGAGATADRKVIGYKPLGGPKAPKAAPPPTGLTTSPFDNTFGNVDYNGGAVMPSNTNYMIVWHPSSSAPLQTGYVAGVNQFRTDIARDSAYTRTAARSRCSTTIRPPRSRRTTLDYGGSFTDTDPLLANGYQEVSGSVADAQLQIELDSFLAANNLPRDLSHEYFLLTPPHIVTCLDSTGAFCSANDTNHATFCAYHSSSSVYGRPHRSCTRTFLT